MDQQVVVPLTVIVAAVVLLIVLYRQPDWSRRGRLLANLLVPVVLVGVVAAGAYGLDRQQEPDVESCEPLSVSKRDAANARKQVRAELRQARARLRETAQAARANPSPATRRAERRARAKEKAVTKRMRSWKGNELVVDDKAQTNFKMGHDVNAGERSIKFTSQTPIPGPRRLLVTITAFVPSNPGRELSRREIRAWAVLERDGQHGTLSFCLPPDTREDAPSGEFQGEFVIADRRVDRLAVPVTLTLAYPDVVRVMGVGLSVAIVTSWYVYFLRRPQLEAQPRKAGVVQATQATSAPANPTTSTSSNPAASAMGTPTANPPATPPRNPSASGGDAAGAAGTSADDSDDVLRWPFAFWRGYFVWLNRPTGAITVVAGLIGAVTAFSTAYMASETWAGTFRDWFAFCGAVATAFLAAGTAGKLAQHQYDTTVARASRNDQEELSSSQPRDL